MSIYLGNNRVSLRNAVLPVEEKDVNFYDWEGTLLYSYTKSEFAELESLPTPPDRTSENLTQEGWNLTKQDITDRINLGWDYVAVGCTYHTTDGKTYMTVEPNDINPTVYLSIIPTVANDVVINWGDGQTTTIDNTSLNELSHIYDDSLYNITSTITINSSNTFSFDKVIEGTNYGKSRITSIKMSGKEVYYTTSNTYNYYGFRGMKWLKYVSLSKPLSNKYAFGLFENCILLQHINMPNNLLVGSRILSYCYTIKRGSIPKVLSGYYAFRDAYNLDKTNALIIGGGSASLASMYRQNTNIVNVIISTSENTNGDSYTFYNCYNLENVEYPATITSLHSYTFSDCPKLRNVYLKATTPPSLSAAFANMNTFYKIWVPRDSLTAYQTATNWADISSHIYPYDYE